MKYIRPQVLSRRLTTGTWCNLGSAVTAEVAGLSGFDWVLLDMEHGLGDFSHLVPQLQAMAATPASPIVRITQNDVGAIKRVLDAGAAGVMIPFINTPEEAKLAISAMRYPPQGIRGAARFTRAATFGMEFDAYSRGANENLLTVLQIETQQAVENVEAIAAIDGADVLFVGPTDLSTNLGVPLKLDDPKFRSAVKAVVSAAHKHNKTAGILLAQPAQIEQAVADGFTFIALGSDGAMVAAGMKAASEALGKHRKR